MGFVLLTEGYRLMRERFAVYAIFAAICAAAAYDALPHLNMYAILAGNPAALIRTSPVSVVLALALAAIFFILPSAVRRIDPSFRMTIWRAATTVATIIAVGVVTELGYALAVLPGIVVAVLLSQALIGALLRMPERSGPSDVATSLVASVRGSYWMTRTHFATTLGIIAASLCILLVPFAAVLFALAILGVTMPQSLVVMAPLLFLTFIYFECVRYAWIVRWYRRLAADAHEGAEPRDTMFSMPAYGSR